MLQEPIKPEEACVCGKPDCPQGIQQAALLNRVNRVLTERDRLAAADWYEKNKTVK